MKKLLFLFLLTFATMIFAAEKEINLPFAQDSSKYWQYISDKTMGGVSDGRAVLEQDGELFFARLTGNVSTKNNGGFIQLRSNLSFANFEKEGKKIKGVRLNVRGNGETYHIFIRTNETKSYRDFYLAPFKANSDWEIIDLPFNKFKHRILKNSTLEDKKIRTFGIVAYGRDFISDVSVSTITFYY
tara:strand:+ start:427 stop:984 length:558 start_codon:yes stop_codon:yes gene_type:complete